MKTRNKEPNELTPLVPSRDVVNDRNAAGFDERVADTEAEGENLPSLPTDVIGLIASHLSLTDVYRLSLVNKKLQRTINSLRQRIRYTSEDMPFMYEDDARQSPATYQYIFKKLNENTREYERAKKFNYTLFFKIVSYSSLGFGLFTGFGGGILMLVTFATAGVIPALVVTGATSVSGIGSFSLYRYASNKAATWQHKIKAMENINKSPELIINRNDEMAVEIEVVKESDITPEGDVYGYHY